MLTLLGFTGILWGKAARVFPKKIIYVPNPAINADFHIKKVEKTSLIRQDTYTQKQIKP